MTQEERDGIVQIPIGSMGDRLDNLTSQFGGDTARFPIMFEGEKFTINNGSWKTSQEGIKSLIQKTYNINR